MKTTHLIRAGVISFALVSVSALQAENLLPQGEFDSGAAGALPEGWTGHQQPHLDRVKGSHALVEESDGAFLRLEKHNEESVLRVETTQKIPTGTKDVTLSVTDRIIDIVPGAENPNRDVFRVGVVFRDAENETIKDAVPQIARSGASSEWKTQSVSYEVPEGSDNVSISLMMLNCTGVWEVLSVELTAN